MGGGGWEQFQFFKKFFFRFRTNGGLLDIGVVDCAKPREQKRRHDKIKFSLVKRGTTGGAVSWSDESRTINRYNYKSYSPAYALFDKISF